MPGKFGAICGFGFGLMPESGSGGGRHMSGPSAFGLVAAGLYCAVGAVAAIAAGRAQISRQVPRHARLWLLVALVFALLALSRVTMAEDWLREWLRTELQSKELYDRRRTLQLPLALLTMVAAFAGLFWWFATWRRIAGRRREGMVHLARLALVVMGALIVVRVISFHVIDGWLHSGPRLNWWLDIGSSLVAGLAALRYASMPGVRGGGG